jgi:hypothetical protein
MFRARSGCNGVPKEVEGDFQEDLEKDLSKEKEKLR